MLHDYYDDCDKLQDFGDYVASGLNPESFNCDADIFGLGILDYENYMYLKEVAKDFGVSVDCLYYFLRIMFDLEFRYYFSSHKMNAELDVKTHSDLIMHIAGEIPDAPGLFGYPEKNKEFEREIIRKIYPDLCCKNEERRFKKLSDLIKDAHIPYYYDDSCSHIEQVVKAQLKCKDMIVSKDFERRWNELKKPFKYVEGECDLEAKLHIISYEMRHLIKDELIKNNISAETARKILNRAINTNNMVIEHEDDHVYIHLDPEMTTFERI